MRLRPLLSATLLLTLLESSPAQLSINEVVAIAVADAKGNQPELFEDEDGHLSDIIEIHNAGGEAISLNGYGLTDNKNNIHKWKFSSNQRIAAGEYLVVYASAKNKTGLFASIPHTNFKLGRAGEYLALVGPDGEIIDEFDPLPKMYDRVSYGHEGYMIRATPGEENSEAVAPPTAGVKFSVKSGTFFEPFTVELLADGLPEGAWIGYTDDGTPPEVSLFSPPKRYTVGEPIEIEGTTQIRARIFEDGKLPSEIETATYVQFAEEYRDWSSNLPVIVLDNDDSGRPPTNRFIQSSMMFFEPKAVAEGEEKRTSMGTEADLHTRSGIRVRGSSTSGNQKMSLAVESWYDDANWADKDITPLGLPADSDWVLSGRMQFDRALIRNPLAYEIFRQMGRWAPNTRFVEVFMNLDGGELDSNDYYGVYAFMEKIKIGDDRVQIEEANGGNDGGFIVKVDRTSKAGGDKSFSVAGQTIVWVEPQGTDFVTSQQNAALKSYLEEAVDAMQSDDPENPETGYRAYIDTPSWIDEYLVRTLTLDPDGLRLSTYLHKPINGKVRYGPVWDFDRTMGCDSDSRARDVKKWSNDGNYFANYGWYRYMIGRGINKRGGEAVLPEFWQEWIDRYHELRRTVWEDDHIHGIIDSMAAEIREAQERNFARWTGTRPPGDVSDYAEGDRTWEGEITHLKGWLSAHMDWMDGQLAAQPSFVNPGVLASEEDLKVKSGGTLFSPQDVYYTTDGSDPRLPGGEINPAAIKGGTTITPTENMSIILRSKQSNLWSGPIKAAVLVDGINASADNLLISEIMYHPRDGQESEQAVGFFHEDLFEFVELTNVSDQPMYLGDLRFTNGITFNFQEADIQWVEAGGRVVLVSDKEAFTVRYGSEVPVAGQYVGKLSNAGENLTLQRGEEIIQSFSFNDRAPWPTTPDEFGFSLTLVDPAVGTDLSDAGQWTVDTSTAGGSPGSEGETPPAVVVNEVLANSGASASDAIELYNASDVEVDISGWWLTDEGGEPEKYAIPAGTKIPAGGYVVIRQDNDNDPANNADLPPEFFGSQFALSSTGDNVWLFSATADGTLTGYRNGFSFGDTDEGSTVGLFLADDGGTHDVIQSAPTLGEANAGPLVSSIVITEIMYNPSAAPPKDAEYVEIYNHTNATAPLHDPEHPDNTWRISGIDYDFPSGASLAAGEVALVVSADPEAFRTAYGLAADVKIFGPFGGRLDNAGESLRLQRPGAPFDDDGVSNFRYITADRVDYDNRDPWPIDADGAGASLERQGATTFANQSSNWIASVDGTPGTFNGSSGGGGGQDPVVGEITGISISAEGVALSLPAGTTYDIEHSTDLETWTVIASDVNGTYEDKDAARANASVGYYRGVVK